MTSQITGQNKKRIFYLDQLRALSIIGVVLIHVSYLWSKSLPVTFNTNIGILFEVLGRFGVPIFLMLSGVLLLNKEYTIHEFLKKRFPRIIYPLLFWMIIFVIVSYFFVDSSIIGNMILYVQCSWYAWVIIGVYLFLPVINDFIRQKGLKGAEYFVVIVIICSIIYSIFQSLGWSLYVIDLSYFLNPLGYVVLGYYLANKEFKLSNKKLILLGIIMFIGTWLLKSILISQGITDFADHHLASYYIFEYKTSLELSIFTLLQATGLFLIFKSLINTKITKNIEKNKITKNITSTLSKYSYGIYLVHYMILGFIRVILPKGHYYPALIWIPLLTISIIIISLIVLYIANKIPYIQKCSGAH